MSSTDRDAAIRPKKSMEDFTREIRARQEEHRAKLLARQDAASLWAQLHKPAYDRIYQHNWRRAKRRKLVAEEVRLAERRVAHLDSVRAEATGELADLIAEQERDARTSHRVRRAPIFVDIADHFRASQLGLVP